MLFSNKDIRKLVIPLIIEQMLEVSVGMLDTVMISYCGEAAVSGVSLVDMINQILLALFAALGTGGAVVVSQFMGADNIPRAKQSARQLVDVAAVISVAVAVLAILLRHPVLSVCFPGIEQSVFDNALIYLVMSALSYPFIGLYNSLCAIFRAQGDSRTPMVLSLMMNIINFCGNALTIYVLHWGVFGAALASLIGRAFACLIALFLLFRPRLRINLAGGSFLPDRSLIRRILYIGIPSGIESSIFQLGRLFGVSIISGFGTFEIAANAVANNLDSLGVMPGTAMQLAVITIVGRCVGAHDFKQAKYYTRKLMIITYTLTILTCGLTILFRNTLFGFYSLSPETLTLANKLVLIHDVTAMVLWPISFVLPNVFRSANDVKFPMVVSISSMVLVRNCLGFLIAHRIGQGCLGVWIAMIFDWCIRSAFFVWRYLSGRWMQFYKD